MKLQTKVLINRILSACVVLSLLFSLFSISANSVFAEENNYEKITLSLNSSETTKTSIDTYLYEGDYYITIDDLCTLTRCSQYREDDIISIYQGFWGATFDIGKQQFSDGYQTVNLKILEVSNKRYAVPALVFLSYFKSVAFIEGGTLYCRMQNTTAWEALNVDFKNSLVDIYELYGGEGKIKFSLTLDILMDFIMGDMPTSDGYLTDAFLEALKVNMYDYSSVKTYKEQSQNDLYNDVHSDKGLEFVDALNAFADDLDDVKDLSAEPTEWYIRYYYNAHGKAFVNAAYDAYEAGQYADVTHYGQKFYENFKDQNKTSANAEKYFDNADYLMLFVSAAADTAQQMKYTKATDNLIYNVMGEENVNYVDNFPQDNDWFRVANSYKNVLGVAATQFEDETVSFFTDKICWDGLVGTAVTSASGITSGAWSFSLNASRFFVEHFPLTSSTVEAFKSDRRAMYLSEMQQNVAWVAQCTLEDLDYRRGDLILFRKYIQAAQLYCRTSIAMYENLITMVDEFGKDRDYWKNLFQERIDMLAVSLYQLTILQEDGAKDCLPMEIRSFDTKKVSDNMPSWTSELTQGYWENKTQSHILYKFNPDGTGVEYGVLGIAITEENLNNPELCHSEVFTYTIKNDKLVIKRADGYTITLAYVSKTDSYQWDSGIIQNLPENEKFFYETSFVETDAPNNAFYLLKYDEHKKEDDQPVNDTKPSYDDIQQLRENIIGSWGEAGSVASDYDFASDGTCYWSSQNQQPGSYEILDNKKLIIVFPWTRNEYTWSELSFDEFHKDHDYDEYFWCFTDDGILILNGEKYYKNGKIVIENNTEGDLLSILEGTWVSTDGIYKYRFYSDGVYEEINVYVPEYSTKGKVDIVDDKTAKLWRDTPEGFGYIPSYTELIYDPATSEIFIGGTHNDGYWKEE